MNTKVLGIMNKYVALSIHLVILETLFSTK